MKGSKPLTKKQAKLLAANFRGRYAERDRALFLLGYNTGFRITELLSITISDVVNGDGTVKDKLTVHRQFMKRKQESRSINLGVAIQVVLSDYLEWLEDIHMADGPLFPSQKDHSKPVTRFHALHFMKAALRRAGIVGDYGTHSMRKSFINNARNRLLELQCQGMPVDVLRETMRLAGHKHIETTEAYVQSLDSEKLQKELIEAITVV